MERAFRIFDKDGSGTVSLAEFIETMHQFSGQGEDEKISFLFKVYDLNGRHCAERVNLKQAYCIFIKANCILCRCVDSNRQNGRTLVSTQTKNYSHRVVCIFL